MRIGDSKMDITGNGERIEQKENIVINIKRKETQITE